jgi:hypothetical protein
MFRRFQPLVGLLSLATFAVTAAGGAGLHLAFHHSADGSYSLAPPSSADCHGHSHDSPAAPAPDHGQPEDSCPLCILLVVGFTAAAEADQSLWLDLSPVRATVVYSCLPASVLVGNLHQPRAPPAVL